MLVRQQYYGVACKAVMVLSICSWCDNGNFNFAMQYEGMQLGNLRSDSRSSAL